MIILWENCSRRGYNPLQNLLMGGTVTGMTDLEAQRLAAVAALRERLDNAAQALRKQADLLRVRGIAPPLHLFNAFASFDTALHQLARAIADEATEIGQLQALAETYAMINSSLDVDVVLAQALDEIIALTGAERGFILLYDPEADALDLRIARGMDGQADASEMSSMVLREVIATGKPILTNNASRDPALAGSDTVARFTLRSILCVPLISRDRVEGAIYVDNRFREGVFTERELTLLTAFANQTAVAVENALLFSQVQAAAREMARAKDLIENVFASIESGVITTDAANTISTLNAAAARILNLQPERAVGQPIAEALPRVFSELEPLLSAVRAQRLSFVTEIRAEVPGRGRAALNFKLSPLDSVSHADQTGVAMVVDDLTEQREREETLDLMQRYLPPGMVENIDQIARLAHGGERREVTCVFLSTCQLAQFPPGLRPPQMMELLNIFLETATEVIHAARGVIDKYMGSEIMVLFNTPLNPEPGHAYAAIRMALALRQAFHELHTRLGFGGDALNAGLHTGVATVGNVGSLNRRNFTALGDSINLARRIYDSAGIGTILMSGETLLHAQATAGASVLDLPVIERTPLTARGRTQPTRIFELQA